MTPPSGKMLILYLVEKKWNYLEASRNRKKNKRKKKRKKERQTHLTQKMAKEHPWEMNAEGVRACYRRKKYWKKRSISLKRCFKKSEELKQLRKTEVCRKKCMVHLSSLKQQIWKMSNRNSSWSETFWHRFTNHSKLIAP